MQSKQNALPPATSPRGAASRYRAGDLVTTRRGYPVLYEILNASVDGLLRVRGVDWAPGFSAHIPVEDVRPASSILSRAEL